MKRRRIWRFCLMLGILAAGRILMERFIEYAGRQY